MNRHESRLRPVAVTIEGFRGIKTKQTLDLSSGLTVLAGDNGSGKSSFLTAVEWCLYGNAVVGKSSSGIPERGDWSVAHRGIDPQEVCVSVAFETGQGVDLMQRRAAVKGQSDIRVTLADGETIRGPDVDDWLAWHQFPDWQTWKNSFFQHQDLARARLTEPARRTDLLSSMLGLGPYRQVHETLKRLRSSRLESVAQETLEVAEQLQQRAAERPHSDLRGWLSQLKKKGIEGEIVGKSQLSERAHFMLAQAREQAHTLRMTHAIIPAANGSARELLSWAADWPAQVRTSLNTVVRERQQLDRKIRSLEAAQDALRPARLAFEDLKMAADRLRADSGDPARLKDELEELNRHHARLDNLRTEQDQLGKLVGDAVALMTAGAERDACPVCDHETRNLREILEARVHQLDSQPLAEEQKQIRTRSAKIEKQLSELRAADEGVAAARRQVSRLEDNVRAQVDAADDEPVDQMLARWREARAELDIQITAAEDHVRQHRDEMEVVSLLVRVLRAQARAEATKGDLSDSPAFNKLQESIDEAAAFACDVSAVSAMARELEDARSQARIEEINQGLEQIYSAIVGRSHHFRIKASRTPTSVSYQLVGRDGAALAGSLNQASINALSLACLLASAQSRAGQGMPQFVLLDEPAQNLDDAHSLGLASVLAEIAKSMPVVVATLPGKFYDALEALCSPDFPPVLLRQAAGTREAGIG